MIFFLQICYKFKNINNTKYKEFFFSICKCKICETLKKKKNDMFIVDLEVTIEISNTFF